MYDMYIYSMNNVMDASNDPAVQKAKYIMQPRLGCINEKKYVKYPYKGQWSNNPAMMSVALLDFIKEMFSGDNYRSDRIINEIILMQDVQAAIVLVSDTVVSEWRNEDEAFINKPIESTLRFDW